MKKIFYIALVLIVFAACTPSDKQQNDSSPQMSYKIHINEPQSHYVNVELNISGLTDSITNLCMPAWAPGYYVILNSARHVVGFKVTAQHSDFIPWRKSEKSRWTIHNGESKNITVFYRVYANQRSVGEAHVNESEAFLPGNEIFMYLEGQTDLPCEVTFHPYAGWSQLVTSLPRTSQEDYTYKASNFDELFDSPTYMGNSQVSYFENEGKHYTLSVVHPGDMDTTLFVQDAKKAISQATKLMGDIPYDNYCIILLGRGGGGLEHANSQACYFNASGYTMQGDRLGLLSFFTHEYFHLYNVKRIRPIELGPFDYSKENYASLLWFSEGATCYYENVLLTRAGISSERDFLNSIEESLRAVENRSGHLYMTLDRSALDIWNNFFMGDRNGTTISYYDKGPLASLLMDIAIRQATANRQSLDDLMRLLYNRYYKELDRGFTEDEFWAAVDEVSGHADMSEIKSYIYTTDDFNYPKFFGYAGIAIDLTPTEEQDLPKVLKRSWSLSIDSAADSTATALRRAIMFGE